MTTLVSKAPQAGSPNCHTQHVLEWYIYIYKNNHVFFRDLRTHKMFWIWIETSGKWGACTEQLCVLHLLLLGLDDTLLSFASPSSKMDRIWTGKHASQSGVQTSDFYSFALKSVCGERNQGKWLDQRGFETLNFKSRNKPGTHQSAQTQQIWWFYIKRLLNREMAFIYHPW